MNCDSHRAKMPLLAYGDLRADEAAAVEQHLADCAACRQQCGALNRLRNQLQLLPAPEVRVDLPGLYRASAEGQRRQARRWRLRAIAATIAAGVLLGILLTRCEVRFDRQQLVVR